MSPKSLRCLFQWSDDEEEASGYASSTTVSSEQTGTMSANMANNNHDNDLHRHMEAQQQTFKAQQAGLDNIRQMLEQLLNNRNNDETTSSNHDEEENPDTKPTKTKNLKGSSAIDADVIKGIQAQIPSPDQRDELKKVGMMRPYPLEWDSVPYPPKFKPPMLHTYDGKSSSNQHIYYLRSQTGNVIDYDVVMARLLIDTLKEVAFDWFRSLLNGFINSWIDLETSSFLDFMRMTSR